MDYITLQKPTYFTGDITIYHVYLRFLRWSTKQPRLLALLGPTFAGGPGSSAAVGSGTEERVSWQLGTGLIHGTVWYGANLGFGWILGMAHGKFIHFHRFGGYDVIELYWIIPFSSIFFGDQDSKQMFFVCSQPYQPVGLIGHGRCPKAEPLAGLARTWGTPFHVYIIRNRCIAYRRV